MPLGSARRSAGLSSIGVPPWLAYSLFQPKGEPLPIDRDVLEAVREMEEPELRRLLILARARLEQRGVFAANTEPEVKLRQQMIKCGKDACTRCPHGPYWYAYWWEEGKRRSRYVGKLDELPEMA